MKTYNLSFNIGRSKYVVNFHDGVKTHKDGSPFYDIAIYSNKRKMEAFVRRLQKLGYVEAVKEIYR